MIALLHTALFGVALLVAVDVLVSEAAIAIAWWRTHP